ncbi:hypothetical protein C2R22_13805 [Salinigranum rubrum]|uniref:Right handed beta helix domain-containing protein n=1 Tax=Salinigranum rubrum TaxID=755307 RepID=A0A2I8VKY6_9EURY|nr:right-handed parallel beta-helix repeat-containing protein [Salinigranum rubrum]AUV82581.1 hypothetical protein C2R22_13805 [Salinigranum rubrum]
MRSSPGDTPPPAGRYHDLLAAVRGAGRDSVHRVHPQPDNRGGWPVAHADQHGVRAREQLHRFPGHGLGRHGGLTFRNLQIDGNWRNQSAPNGFGVEIRGTGIDPITFEGCRISNWGTNGGNLNTNAVIRSCDFIGNGHGAARYDRLGHGLNVTLDASNDETLLVENCLFRNNTGAAIDSQQGEITFRNTVVEESGFGFKHHKDTHLTVENCRFRNISSRPWYMIPGRQRLGTVRCIDTVFENAGWPAFDFPSPADFRGDNILIIGANQNNERDGSFYARAGGNFDLGRLSIHDSAHGAALELLDCSGRIEELVHSGNPGGVGVTEGVEIGTVTRGDPISLDPPVAEDVGAR